MAREGASVLVANRTTSRAKALAERIGGEELPMTSLDEGLARADLVLSSTGSSEPVITRELVAGAFATRVDRPLVLLDLAVPRDVEPSVADIDGVVVRDLDDLREALTPGPDQLREVGRVRDIIEEEVPRFTRWQRSHHLAPLLEALQARGEQVRDREVKRAMGRLARLSDAEREAVEALARSIVAKLFHGPVTAVKQAAGTADGEALARALRDLFDLPDIER
jgi:glutamyl-tRNA reductase